MGLQFGGGGGVVVTMVGCGFCIYLFILYYKSFFKDYFNVFYGKIEYLRWNYNIGTSSLSCVHY